MIDGQLINYQYLEAKLARLRDGAPLRVVDLFAGCGGMSLGFKRAGYDLLGGVENDSNAARTYAINFFKGQSQEVIERHSTPQDMRTLPPQRFMQEVLRREDPGNLVDVIIGGPPCQAFARVGRAKLREIMNHPEAYRADERASLYLHYLEYVAFFQPLAVIIENVPDIMNFGGLNVAEEIANSLEEWGYQCRYTILNSAHYGVPQLRHRFFLIALPRELGIEPCFPNPTHFIELPSGYHNIRDVATAFIKPDLFNQGIFRYTSPPEPSPHLPPAITARQAIADLPPLTRHLQGDIQRGPRKFDTLAPYNPDIPPSVYASDMRSWPGFESQDGGVWDHVTRSLPRDVPIFKDMQQGAEYPEAHNLALKLLEKAIRRARRAGRPISEDAEEYRELRASIVPPYDPLKFPNKWWKLKPDEPVRTLTAHIGKDTYSHIHYDGAQARVISVREAARLQSFPDGFEFVGPMNPAFKQIGNAVPPQQAHILASHLRELLLRAVSRTAEIFSTGPVTSPDPEIPEAQKASLQSDPGQLQVLASNTPRLEDRG